MTSGLGLMKAHVCIFRAISCQTLEQGRGSRSRPRKGIFNQDLASAVACFNVQFKSTPIAVVGVGSLELAARLHAVAEDTDEDHIVDGFAIPQLSIHPEHVACTKPCVLETWLD